MLAIQEGGSYAMDKMSVHLYTFDGVSTFTFQFTLQGNIPTSGNDDEFGYHGSLFGMTQYANLCCIGALNQNPNPPTANTQQGAVYVFRSPLIM